jgi:small subunit ribosomal protein S10e
MFIPKANRIAVFKYLFSEGVIVVKKDTVSNKHPHIEGPTNLEVLMLVRSLSSRGYVKMTYNWLYYYCYLTKEGIAYLRQYLALPEDVKPATHIKPAGRPEREEEQGDRGDRGDGRRAFRGDGDREYRGRPGGFGRGGGA